MPIDDVPRLLSLMSHELRAPLGVIRGYLRLLDQQAQDLPEHHRTAIARALKASDRAVEILADVSTLAHFGRNEVAFELKPVTLAPLLHAAAGDVTLPVDPAVQLEVVDAAGLEVMADAPLLRTALAKLATMVVRAQPSDTTLRIRALREAANGRDGVAITIGPASADGLISCGADISRGGSGIDLPLAGEILAAHHGNVVELRDHNRLAGVVVWVPSPQ